MYPHRNYINVYEDLLSDPGYATRKATRALKKALRDPEAWLGDWNWPNRHWLLVQLGFPEEMPKNAVRRYWSKLCEAEIIRNEWRFKAGLILTALGNDPFSWLQRILLTGAYSTEIVAEIGLLLQQAQSLVTLATDNPVLLLTRYGYDRGLLKISPFFWDLIMRDSAAVKDRVRSVMARALDCPDFWSPTGNLKWRYLLQELGMPEDAGTSTRNRVWKRIESLGAFPPICRYKVAFILYALGFDPLTWVQENCPKRSPTWGFARCVNELLAQRGHWLRITKESTFKLNRYLRRKGATEVPSEKRVIESLGLNLEQVRRAVEMTVRLALNDSGFWNTQGVLRKRIFLEAVVGKPLSRVQKAELWEELVKLRVIDPACAYTVGFALKALGFDPVGWVKEKYQPATIGAQLGLARKLNSLLEEAGCTLRVSEYASSSTRFLHSMIRQDEL
ncbi:MAG: hypothetical protein Q8N84_03775 [bacterium]|nr:hypothetical protein [bacterium]